MTTIKTTITKSTEHNFHQYDSQCQPQPAYIAVDTRDGEIWSCYSVEIGNAFPMAVYRGEVIRWNIPAYLTLEAINTVMRIMQPDIEQFINNSDRDNDEVSQLEQAIAEATCDTDMLMHIVDDWAEMYDCDIDTMCDVASAKTAKEYDDAVTTDANDSIDNLHVASKSTPSEALAEIIVNASMLADSEIAKITKTNRWLLSNDDVVSAIEDSDDSEGM